MNNENDANPWHLADYYAILGVTSGFTEIQLLRHFLRRCKQGITAGDQEAIMAIRRGFEVLRYEDTRIAYYRMHRLLVRKEPLRFPEGKKREMLHEIRLKEALALSGSKPVIMPGKGYDSLLDDVWFGIARKDVARMYPFGASGLALLLGLPFLVAVNGLTWVSLTICAAIAPIAILHLRERVKDYVTDP